MRDDQSERKSEVCVPVNFRPTTVSVWAICYSTLLVVIIYGPVGWSMMGLIEEWDIFSLFKKFGVFYVIADASSPLFAQRIRPLITLPYAIGYWFGPDAFVALHFLQATSLVLKGLAVAVIVNWLVTNRLIAVMCGLIFMVFPADTMQMTLRSVHINCALALSIFGVALLVDATRRNKRSTMLFESVLAGIFFITGSLIYEASLFLAPLPLLLWWARYGWSDGLAALRAQIGPVAIWCSVVAIATAYVLVTSLSGHNYEMEVVGDHQTMAHNVLTRIPLLFKIALYRLFAHGWYDGFRMLLDNVNFWPWLIGATIIFISLPLLLSKPSFKGPREWSRATRIIAAGLAAAIFGYLPYLTSFFHMMTSQRTYLYAAIGGTIVIAGVMYALAKVRPLLAVLLAALCLLSGLGNQWQQMVHYTALSHRQRMILAGVLGAAPDAARSGSKRILILDRSGATNNGWMLRGWGLGKALAWFYGTDVEPLVCTEAPGQLFSSFLTTPSGRPARCLETATGWAFGDGPDHPIHFAKSDLRVLTIEPDGRVTAPTMTEIPQPAASVTANWQKMLGCWPAAACRSPMPDATGSSVRFDFGKYWGLDDAPWGGGWKDEEWDIPSRNPVSWSWMIASETNLWFQIKAQGSDYAVIVRVSHWINQAAKDSLAFSLNGRDLDAYWIDSRNLQANFNASILISGPNELRLKAEQDLQNGLSVAVDQVDIGPVLKNKR